MKKIEILPSHRDKNVFCSALGSLIPDQLNIGRLA